MSGTAIAEVKLGKRRIEEMLPSVRNGAVLAGVVGALLVGLSMIFPQFRERIAASYLAAFTFYLGTTLGVIWFVVLQHLVKAGWSVVVRRVAEGLSMTIILMAVLFVPVIAWMHLGYLHPWAAQPGHAPAAAAHEGGPTHEGAEPAHEGAVAHEQEEELTALAPGSQAMGQLARPSGLKDDDKTSRFTLVELEDSASRAGYLTLYGAPSIDPVRPPGFFWRMAFYLALWIGMAAWYRARSIEQDTSGDPALTSRMEYWSAPVMVAFGLSMAFGGIDLLMTLDPHWYSTMFGVYFFAGSVVSAFAVMILALVLLQRHGLVPEVNAEHYHDLGKLMFAFVIFWAYIGYSQFMLIWYGNVPEEVAWFQRRVDVQSGWLWMSAWLVVGHFVIPFFVLLSRFPKRKPTLLALGALWILFVHYCDVLWLVLPEPGKARSFPVPLLDLGLFLSMGALYVYVTAKSLTGASLIPERDPRLAVSIAHENF